MVRFISKNRNRRVIRPMKHGDAVHKIQISKPSPTVLTTVVAQPVEEKIKETEQNANMDNNLEKLQSIIGDDTKAPKRRVKKEKKDKGLIERTEESTIVINEDNKMLLND